jgi:hypothetical protein
MDRCKYVFLAGMRKGLRCGDIATINGYCAECSKKNTVKFRLYQERENSTWDGKGPAQSRFYSPNPDS